ncbi:MULTISPECIES: peptide ABC transporter substrate-binding protein [Rhizobium]|uniref:Oligopeptide transport system substrate-binding protein n=1 Tax=Rhizobium miluonense TaxID=411945 RepID=A0ABU1SN08_9HYPH|nr:MULTISPECIES: peptide ABC transporter substrate-binding protein [Rhizobium]MBB3381619.1 oligopeptide transport system substrate-binding protein [Rhizobium sp. BK098]MBB3423718.1 oligopeptide transport system substrate-binding protein [Rhizobium sp. BK312]MBB3566933.1 oligopeptide transport system substrate-binding protein [Rhizobium sp. BK491]MBB3613321.1 oligopeptide transport system substrate-binding protein [Rhizobium sp. BK609]MBB3678979.1 oligopeptide transport system substrate-binding
MAHITRKFIAAAFVSTILSVSAHAATLNIHNGGDPTSLDPQKISGDWENRIDGDIFEGLVTEDPKDNPIPGQAASWTISPDQKVYTFKLRDGIKWSDGQPVTAQDFVFAFQRLMDPKTAAQYAYLQYTILNAEKINKGEIKDLTQLGVKAIDDKTLEITLENPTPYFLNALMHYTAYPLPKHVVEAKGDQWVKIGNIVTNGPYKPTEWVPGSHVSMVKSDQYYDAKDIKIDNVNYYTLEDQAAALKRYRAGEFDILTSFPADQFDWIQKNLPGQAHVVPFLGTYYYVLNSTKPPFNDKRVRQALSMAVNREVIGPKILGTGELPSYSWVPPGTANYGEPAYVSWKDEPYKQKVEEAKKLLKEAGFGPDHPLKAQLRYNTNDNHKRIAVAIAAMWKPLGVDIELYNTETKVHYDEMQRGEVQIGRAGWLADYNDPINFLNLLSTGVEMNYGRWSNKDYDALIKQGNEEIDLKKRAEIYKKAEQLALDDSAAIPIYYYVSQNIVAPKVQGFVDNIQDIHRTRWLSVKE